MLTEWKSTIAMKWPSLKSENSAGRSYSPISSQLKFQCKLLLEIRTIVDWLKSTLLLIIKWFDTNIYMKTQCLQTNEI